MGGIEKPQLIFDADVLVGNIMRFKKMTDSVLSHKNVNILYAIKANSHKRILDIMFDYGLGAQVESYPELMQVPKSIPVQVNGFPKSAVFLAEAVKRNACMMDVENIRELHRICEMAQGMKRKKKVGITISIKIPPDGGRGMDMHGISQIGACLKNSPTMRPKGLHFHIGGNIRDDREYENVLDSMLSIHRQLGQEGIPIECWNIGGIFGEHQSFPGQLNDRLTMLAGFLPEEITTVYFEAGRYFTGDAGNLMAQVVSVEDRRVRINSLTYGYQFTGATPFIEHISRNTGDRSRIAINNDARSMCIAGIGPGEGDHIYFGNRELDMAPGDTLAFHNMGAYIDGTHGASYERRMLSYKFVGNLHLLTRKSGAKDKAVICKYYKDQKVALPVNKQERYIILQALAGQFTTGKKYDEGQVNSKLSKFNPDCCFLRRELVAYSLMEREECMYFVKK